MRCLYCGKELALLKRLTGGGEFCSDAHRHQYQEEYNQLALNRLLQAKPREKQAEEEKAEKGRKAPAPEPAEMVTKAPERVAPPIRPAEPIAPLEPVAAAPRYSEPVRASTQQREEPVPAELGGFIVEMPEVKELEPAKVLTGDIEPVTPTGVSLPSHDFQSQDGRDLGSLFGLAGPVPIKISFSAVNGPSGPSARSLESRDFPRGNPVLDPPVPAGAGSNLRFTDQPVDFAIPPQAPPPTANLWQEPEREFRAIDLELGGLARVSFPTTGVTDDGSSDEPPDGTDPPAPDEPAIELESRPEESRQTESPPVAVPPPEPRRLDRRRSDAVRLERVYVAPASPLTESGGGSTKTSVAEAEFEKPHRTSVRIGMPLPQPGRRPEPVPDFVTKTMPVPIDAIAAGRGKPLPVIAPAVSGGIDVQVPRSTALPLRPVIIFGPAPAVAAPKVNETKAPERSPSASPKPASRPDLRGGKSRKREGRIPEPNLTEPNLREPSLAEPNPAEPIAPAPAASTPAARPDFAPKEPPPPPAPEPKPAAIAPEPKPATVTPARPTPMPTPRAASEVPMDLGLPTLSVQKSGGLSKVVILGIAAAVLAIGGIVYLTMRGGGADAATAAAGPALASADWAWVNDWANDAAAHRQRQISVLGPSVELSDYRVEFEGQIQNKALGWVYRAKDPKNFYVTKLLLVKSGSYPAIALERFAVINGEEQPRVQVPVTMPVTRDNNYKIRFQAVGKHFTTWIQDQKVDELTDDRIKSGGVGQYREQGETSSLKNGMTVIPLMKK